MLSSAWITVHHLASRYSEPELMFAVDQIIFATVAPRSFVGGVRVMAERGEVYKSADGKTGPFNFSIFRS